MKTIFITGASSGIGKATSILFAQRGWKVISTMRTPEKGKDLLAYENIEIRLMYLEAQNNQKQPEITICKPLIINTF